MEIYQSSFININIDQEASIIKFVWSENASYEKISDDIFRTELLKETELIEKHEVKYVLADTLNLTFPIIPTTQVWVDREIYPRWIKAGVQKLAVTISKEFIAQLSIEQAVEENSSEGMVSQFFENQQKALAWLAM